MALPAQQELFQRVRGALALALATAGLVVFFGLAVTWIMDGAAAPAVRPMMDGKFSARGGADYAQSGMVRIAPVGGVARR